MVVLLKRFSVLLTNNDWIDVTLFINDNTLVKFALNYRAFIDEKWVEVYRVDNYHNYLHEQKFWRSRRPVLIHDDRPLDVIFTEYLLMIKSEYLRFRRYME